MNQKILIVGVIILAFCCVKNASAHRISCGTVNGKATKLPKPKRPSNLSGKIEVEIKIDRGGLVYSAEAMNGNPILRERALEKAVKARFAPTLFSGRPVFINTVLEYDFVFGKSKAVINIKETKFPTEFQELDKSKFACTAVEDELIEYLTSKIVNNREVTDIELKYLKVVIVPEENNDEFRELLSDFDFKIISDNLEYFSGVYGEIRIDKAIDLAKSKLIKNAFGLDDLEYCDGKLDYKANRNECDSLKDTKIYSTLFYGDISNLILNSPIPTDSNFSNNKAFVQTKFDSNGVVLEAKVISGNSAIFNQAEKEVMKMKIKPLNIDNGLGYAIGLIVYIPDNSPLN